MENPSDKLLLLSSSHFMALQDYQKSQVHEAMTQIFNCDEIYHIIDANAHVGCDSINFAKIFPNSHITCIEIDSKAIDALKLNVKTIDETRFDIVQHDCLSYIRSNQIYADIYYFDPPWGGYNYIKVDQFDLYLGDENIYEIINFCIKNGLTRNIILKIPRNFNIEYFASNVDANISQYEICKQYGKKIAYYLLHIFV